MVVIGIDAHKRSHTAVVVDEHGRQLAAKTAAATSKDHLALLRWACGYGTDRLWAVEDCRNMTRRLEADLLAAGERIVRVPPKLMANARDSARTYGRPTRSTPTAWPWSRCVPRACVRSLWTMPRSPYG
jgi:transposase